MSIVGYYHANKRAADVTFNPVAGRIAETILARAPKAAICLFDPAEVVPDTGDIYCALKLVAQEGKEGPWRRTDKVLKLRGMAAAEASATLAAGLAEGGAVERVVDFDDHFDNLGLDWRNEDLVDVPDGGAGGDRSESKGAEESPH